MVGLVLINDSRSLVKRTYFNTTVTVKKYTFFDQIVERDLPLVTFHRQYPIQLD